MSFSKSFPALIETISRRGLYSGGGAYTWMNICVLKTLFFVQVFYFFTFNNVLTTLNTTDIAFTILQKKRWISNPVFNVQFFAFSPKFNVMFKFNYSKYNHQGLIFGGANTWKEFSVSKVGS